MRVPRPSNALVATALYVALAFVSFLPLSLKPRDHIAYVGDSLESVYIVAWNVHQAFRAPARLFDANVLHPHVHALAFTDHRLLPSLLVAPVVWATHNPVLATNVAVLLVCLLAALGARRLALLLGTGEVAAWAAGALYAFNTYQVNEAPRLNIVAHGFLAWALGSLVLYLRTGGRRHAGAAAGFLLLQGLSSNYHLLYGSLLFALVLGGALVMEPRAVARRLPTLALCGLVAGLLFLPVARPYLHNAREQGYARELPAGIDLRHYLSTAPSNLIYGPIGLEVRVQQRGPHFTGFVPLLLAALAVAAWFKSRGTPKDGSQGSNEDGHQKKDGHPGRDGGPGGRGAGSVSGPTVPPALSGDRAAGGRERVNEERNPAAADSGTVSKSGTAVLPALLPARIWVPAALLLTLTFVLLSLGRDVSLDGHRLGPGPYRLLHAWVPGFRLVRIPERLGLLAMLFLALLAARGISLVGQRWRVVALALAAMVPLEHLSPLGLVEQVPVGRRVPEAYRWLDANPAGATAEVPTHGEGLVREETLEMYFSTVHWRRTIHGYTAYPPLLTGHLRRLAAQFPHEVALQAFARVGVDTVVVHHGRPLGLDIARRLRDTAAFDEVRFPELLRRAQQDLFDELPRARAAGRLSREARFEGAGHPLFRSAADEIYRLAPVERAAAAPFPSGHAIRGSGWRYRTKVGDPLPAADGNLATDWVVPRALLGDEFYEISFDTPVEVSGLVLRLRRDSAFPTAFRVAGRGQDGRWTERARFDDAHQIQLLDTLLADSRHAALGFALDGRPLTGLSLLVDDAGTSFEGWRIPEVEVWTP